MAAESLLDDSAAFLYVPTMSKAAKQAPDTGAGAMPFEEALQKLEGIVDSMESGDLPLEKLLERFEEGTRLARVCQLKLAEAEVRIQQLEKAASGEFILKPVTLAEGSEQ